MSWELAIIEGLQNLRSGFFDGLNLFLTYFGDELFFIIVAVFIYWCIDKRFGYKFINVYFFSVAANEGLKVLIKRPRPFVKYSESLSVGEKTSGYSFPSGHSQSIANIGTQVSLKYGKKHKSIIWTALALTVIVMFTRMYLGQHYFTDVITGAALGIALAFVLSKLFDLLGENEEKLAYVIVPVCIILTIILAVVGEGSDNILKMLGAYTAVSAGYYIEKRFVGYDVKSGNFYKYVLKLLLGIAVALGLKEGLKFILPESIPVLYSYLRYFLVAAWAAVLAPLCFKALKI